MRIAVIGGGAAGFFGAIAAATRKPGAKVVIYEATHQPLDKVRISGGGRCNVTHHCFDPAELVRHYPRGAKELLGPFHRFQPRDTVAWFAAQGVRLKAENDGRMFPVTDQSSTIVDCLLTAATRQGVELRQGVRVKAVTVVSGNRPQFDIAFHNGAPEQCDRLLLATGNSHQGHRLAESLGHSIVPCVPSLYTFKIVDPLLDDLSGISFPEVNLTLLVGGKELYQTGPLLITHWGLSGPAVLKLSAWGARPLHDSHYRADLIVDFLPQTSAEQLYHTLVDYKEQNGRKRVQSESPLPIPRRFWSRVVQLSGVPETATWSDLPRQAMTSIVTGLTNRRLAVTGKGIFKEEFVTCGGVSLKEIDFKTMQSKRCPGLYFAGEILDIDAVTGGFNFQSAWTTGWIAGESMVD